MKEKKVEVPLGIDGAEYEMLKGNLEVFNENIGKGRKLTFDEFVSLAFETASLEEKIDSKKDYLKALKAEVRELEEELQAKYSMGLTGDEEDYEDAVKSRKQALRDSSNCINAIL